MQTPTPSPVPGAPGAAAHLTGQLWRDLRLLLVVASGVGLGLYGALAGFALTHGAQLERAVNQAARFHAETVSVPEMPELPDTVTVRGEIAVKGPVEVGVDNNISNGTMIPLRVWIED